MVKVLIVEDSRVVSEYLEYILNQDPEIQVIGNVSNGKAAIKFINENKPDVVTMDINMPIMDGLEATRFIMSTNPLPIIIVSASQNTNEVSVSLEALAAGAVSVIEKPVGVGHPQEKEKTEKLVKMVKLMAEVKVITRKQAKNIAKGNTNYGQQISTPKIKSLKDKRIVAIGVSSGGPHVLQKIFSGLTSNFPYPIVVVQHISKGFLEGLVNWLSKTSPIPIHIASNNEYMLPGHIYFAPNHHKMSVKGYGKIVLSDCEPTGICPSIAHLFNSVEQEYGDNAIGILLTGMGSDGAYELKKMREAGALTIAQDKESSLIYGMPKAAASIGAADYIMSTDEIAAHLQHLEKSN